MTAIREFAKVKNHQLHIELPEGFDYDEVEVIVMPRGEANRYENLEFLEEKKRLQKSKQDIDSGKVKLLSEEEADSQIEAFLSEL